ERKAKYKKYDHIEILMMIVVHFKLINENNVFIEPKVGISDYDLDEDDIR
ncbi:14168_t:CDS:2, partial [Rhizophagus irregularis]